MCRIAAYAGPPRPLSHLLYESPHSLEDQSYRPREMVSGHVNVDGTGAVWWSDSNPSPLRYVTERPPWSDPNLPGLAERLRGSPILATVRSATPGIPSGPGAVLPFVHGELAGTHNGYIGSFREATCAALLALLPAELLGRLETVTDSALLFLLAVRSWRESGDMESAALEAVRLASQIARDAGAPASLNLVLATVDGVVAIRHAVDVESNTLYTRFTNGAGWIASEPLDDHDWRAVQPDHLVRLTPAGVEHHAVDLRPARAE